MNDFPRKPKLLVVDDDPNIRNMLLDIFSMRELDVATAEDGSSALQEATREQYDLCVLDIAMPGMDGLEVCRRLRALPFTRTLAVLFLTSYQDAKTINEAFALGGTDYVFKPINTTLLWARVNNLLKMNELTRMTTQTREAVTLLDAALKPRFKTVMRVE